MSLFWRSSPCLSCPPLINGSPSQECFYRGLPINGAVESGFSLQPVDNLVDDANVVLCIVPTADWLAIADDIDGRCVSEDCFRPARSVEVSVQSAFRYMDSREFDPAVAVRFDLFDCARRDPAAFAQWVLQANLRMIALSA